MPRFDAERALASFDDLGFCIFILLEYTRQPLSIPESQQGKQQPPVEDGGGASPITASHTVASTPTLHVFQWDWFFRKNF